MILPDNETRVDLLNNETIAATIIKLVKDRPDQPVSVGVHGDWGAGKSSVLEMIEAGFENEEKVLCLKFNGWKFQGFEDAKIALIEGIVTGLVEERPTLTKAGVAVKEICRRVDWLKVARRAGGLAVTAFTGIPSLDQVQDVVRKLESSLGDPAKLADGDDIRAAIDGLQGLMKPGESRGPTSVPEEINAFQKAFRELLDKADVDQLVVLIDDLDRCLPDIAIATLEAVRLFVFTSRTAFVVAADEAMIEYAVRRHFPDLPDATGSQTYARNYLEKLIQVPFRIPALGETETRVYVTLLLIGAELGDGDPAFSRLIAVARERLRRPWIAGALDIGTVKEALGDAASNATNALALSDQIGPILGSGTKGNPRQIKRFLNTLELRKQTADARGFGHDVKVPVLAKLMLAERFLPHLFDQIAVAAAAASDGKCSDLSALEAEVLVGQRRKGNGASKETANSKVHDQRGSAAKHGGISKSERILVDEWQSSPAIMAWAGVPTPIGDVDLRPYLFVAKDRKDYFGVTSTLGHLATLVEQLLGDKFTVQSVGGELARLAPPEAIQVFEAVRGRVLGVDSFESEPPGVAGLTELVKAHPNLQKNLVDFLETLPHDRLGPWACKGWESVLRDSEEARRFESLLTAWSKEGGSMLKVAANGVLRTRQRGR